MEDVFQNFYIPQSQSVLRSETFRGNESPDGLSASIKSQPEIVHTMLGKRPQSHGTKKNGEYRDRRGHPSLSLPNSIHRLENGAQK